MTTRSREELMALQLSLRRFCVMEHECYVDSDTDDHPDHSYSWCFEHANMVAKVESIISGSDMWVYRAEGASDYVPYCQWYGCQFALNPYSSGLSQDGIESELGITEEKVLEVPITPEGLYLVFDSLTINDPLMALWEWHACRFFKLPLPPMEVHRGCNGVILMRHEGWKCTKCKKLCPAHAGETCMTCIADEGKLYAA